MTRAVLPAVLALIGITLFATAVPGTFIVDEHAYIATIVGLRDGSYRLPATAGLPPSPELLSFDAAPRTRIVVDTPVATNTPPLYAIVAFPFSVFGIRGLIALQVVSFLACVWLVMRVVRRETGREELAWLALGVVVAGGFLVEYAQAVWPQATTMALVMAAVDAASRLRHTEFTCTRVAAYAALAGVCIGCAAGMRYQNITIVATLVAVLWTAKQRRIAISAYLLGATLPLVACSLINASRLGTANPVSKGGGYLSLAHERSTGEVMRAAAFATYARVVDYTAWQSGPGDVVPAESGAFVLGGGIKKSLLQSAPWMIVPLLALLAAWRARRERFLRGIGVVVAGTLGTFALYGFRSDGWSYNQRYLLELVPLLVVTLAVALASWQLAWRRAGIGLVVGAVLAGIVITTSDGVGGQIAMMKVPLAIAATLGGLWLARIRWPRVFDAALGLAFGWAAVVHLADDLPAGRGIRSANAERLARFAHAVPTTAPLALFAYGRARDAYGPLLLSRDIVIIDPWIDDGRDAVTLLERVREAGRTVIIDGALPATLRARLAPYQPIFMDHTATF